VGAPRIHGELLKLGFEIAQSTVSKYLIRHRGPPSQTWRTFLRNHADAIAAIDLCVVPTVTFECLFAFLVVGHGRRQLLWFAVTRHPTAEWLAQQIMEAFPWDTAPTYLGRNNDGTYGQRTDMIFGKDRSDVCQVHGMCRRVVEPLDWAYSNPRSPQQMLFGASLDPCRGLCPTEGATEPGMCKPNTS
jgi:hypothetical protein